MDEDFAQTIRPKLDVIDKVRPYLADQNIDLPAIVVIGDQSSGKSSLLESISGEISSFAARIPIAECLANPCLPRSSLKL